MLQKELAKRLKARYDTKMDGNEWLEVSSDGIPLCRIKYNGQFLSNADQKFFDYKAFGSISAMLTTVNLSTVASSTTTPTQACWTFYIRTSL